MMRQFELVERVKSYDPNADEDALNRALAVLAGQISAANAANAQARADEEAKKKREPESAKAEAVDSAPRGSSRA